MNTPVIVAEHEGPASSWGHDRPKSESPTVRVILCVREHQGDVAEVVSARLRDPFPNLEVVCLLDSGDAASPLRQRFGHEPRVSFRSLPPKKNEFALRAFVGRLSNDGLVLWQSGDKRIVYECLAEARPPSIEPEDQVAYHVDDELETHLAAPPEYLNIGLTNHCHYRCFFCCAEKARADATQRSLSLEQFFSLQPAIESAGVVDLTSPGEVLLYPHVQDAMAFVARHNRNRGLMFTTTGALLSEELIALVAPRVDQLTVSLNAATPQTYQRDMGSRLWDRVLSNVRVARRHLDRTKITLSFVAHTDNLHELPDLVRLAAELDVWHIRVAPFFVTKPEFVRRSLWFCKEKTQDILGEARRMGETRGVIVSNIHESAQQISSSIAQQCLMPTWGAYIIPNGDVLACCYSDPHIMGNVHRAGSFEKIWNGKKYRALRKRLYFRQCRECPNIRKDIERLGSHIATEILSEARALLPPISVAVQTPASPEQVRSAVACLKRQTYPVWEAVFVLAADGDPAVLRAVQHAAKSDSRVRCVSASFEAACALVGNGGVRLACSLDPAHPFKANALEMHLKAIQSANPVAPGQP